MGRRKRKKVSFRLVRTVPKIFTCPSCGHKTIKVTLRKQKENKALVICGHCGQQQEVPKTDISEAVDAFGEFIDIYFKDQEYERLTRRAQALKEKGEYTELSSVYAFLADNATVNAEKALEEHEKNKDPKDLENAEKWKSMADEYKKEEKFLLEQLRSGQLTDLKQEENVYDEQEVNPFDEGSAKVAEKPKRRSNIEDILDPGFLEF